MIAVCSRCSSAGCEIAIDEAVSRGLPPAPTEGAKAYECKKCKVVWGLLPAPKALTESDAFGDLTDFKIQNPAVEPNLEIYDGGKKLLDQVSGLVSRSSRNLLYETPHERYRNTCSLIDQLRFLKMRLPQPTHLTETVDKIIKHVKDTSPFHQ
jgi:hypothetical protein